MIKEFFFMNGYGIYVWSAFLFTLFNFVFLFIITKIQFTKEYNKFVTKFGRLTIEEANSAKSQKVNKEILSNISKI